MPFHPAAGAVRTLCGLQSRLLARVVPRREQLDAPCQQCAMVPILLTFDMNQVARTQVDEEACSWPAVALRVPYDCVLSQLNLEHAMVREPRRCDPVDIHRDDAH